MKAIVLLNPSAGALFRRRAARDPERISSAFAGAGIEAEVELVEHEALEPFVERAARRAVDMVVVGGGDGSIGSAAGVLAGGDIPLGILPFGTLNHFARDLGVPLRLDDAVAVLAEGLVRRIDVAEVNGLTFVNNASIGAHAQLVEQRETRRRHGHMTKARAGVHAFASVYGDPDAFTLTIDDGARAVTLSTIFMLVANNRYSMGVPGFGRRSALDDGELCVYLAGGDRRFDAYRSLAHLVTRIDEHHGFQALAVPELTVTVDAPAVTVCIDGEVRQLPPRLLYRSRRRALRVVAPAARRRRHDPQRPPDEARS